MERYLFIAPVLARLSDGRTFRRLISASFWVMAIIFVLGGIGDWIAAWQRTFSGDGFEILGKCLFLVLYPVGIYMIAHVLIIRASDVSKLSSSDFILIPIVAIIFKALGDVFACAFIVLGVGGGILNLTGNDPNHLIFHDNMPGLADIFSVKNVLFRDLFTYGASLQAKMDLMDIGSIEFVVSAGVAGVVSLVFFYMLAELTLLFENLARDVRLLRLLRETSVKVSNV